MKGTGETHPALSPNDEFANFEIWDKAGFGPVPTTPDMFPREYAREALKRGLAYEAKLGVNPFKFGMVGSTDSHTSLSTTQEDNFFGKVVILEPSADPIHFEEVIAGRPAPPGHQLYARQTSASGLAAVWARENTREAWDAMSRKEVFATTGTRVRVLEIPTPRWTTFDHKVFGVKLPNDVPASIQERAYTSPNWYTP